MTDRRFDRVRGVAVTFSLILRALLRPFPPPRSTAQRLAMLPDALPADSPVTIHWNEHQVPFIEAQSDTDLAAGLGAVHAHLRLGQIEIMRRIALGRIAESIGPLGIEIDRTIRLFGIARAVPGIIAALPEATRRWAEAFLAGFNHCTAHLARGDNLPHEFAVLGLKPEPWTLTDLFTVARLASADVNWMVSARLLRARAAMRPEEWRKLWPLLLLEGAGANVWAEAAAPVSDAAAAEQALAQSARGVSNCAVVAASRAAGGGAMIASDPHLPMMLPPVWLIAGMHAPGINAVGLMLPGLPFIALGRNAWIAWGGTNLHAASSELFDVSSEPLTENWETIRVRGIGARRIRLRESRLGPVVSDGALLRSATPLALRWVGHRPSDELSAMLAVARASKWEDFRAALTGFAVPGQNFLYAGSDGRVGRVLGVHVPQRGGKPDDLVATPARAAEWDELATAREHPVLIDPPDGVIASANQEPGGTTVPVGFFFSPVDRAARMRTLLAGNPRITAADLQRMQMDVMQPGALAIRDRLLRAQVRPDGGNLAQVFDAIADWDGSYAADSRGAAAFELLFGHLAAALGAGERIASLQAVWTTRHLLARELAGLPAARLQAVLATAFARTARALARWPDWGALHRLRLRHPFARVPLLGSRYSFGEFPLAGGNETVFKTAAPLSRRRHYVGFGTCARHISDLADPDDNRFVLLGGQDGWLGSANFTDQAALWRAGGYITVPLRVETARARFPHQTLLQPVGSAAGR